jgi:hypothetical protein
MAALERRRMANLCRIRKPLFNAAGKAPAAKSAAMTDSQQDGFFEAAPQEIQPRSTSFD